MSKSTRKMLLNLSQDHKRHLEFLVNNDVEVIDNFGSIAVEFLRNGVNKKTFGSAAQKLAVDASVVENAVQGLMQLFTEGTRFMLSDVDFHDSLLLIGFSGEACNILTGLYQSHFKETKEVLNKIVPSLPVYENLEWRFDIKVATRALHHQITPVIYLKITTSNGNSKKEHILETDVVNLLHITNTLEDALNEMKSNHCRRILRNIK